MNLGGSCYSPCAFLTLSPVSYLFFFSVHTPPLGLAGPDRWTAGLCEGAGEGGMLSIKSKQSKFCCDEQGDAASHVGLPGGPFLKSEEISLHQRKLGTNLKTAGTSWNDLAGHGDPDILQPPVAGCVHWWKTPCSHPCSHNSDGLVEKEYCPP